MSTCFPFSRLIYRLQVILILSNVPYLCLAFTQIRSSLRTPRHTPAHFVDRYIQCVHCAGLLDVRNILSADTGISRKTEGHSFGDHLSSESVRVTPSCVIEASIVHCSVLLWLMWVNVQSACALNTRYYKVTIRCCIDKAPIKITFFSGPTCGPSSVLYGLSSNLFQLQNSLSTFLHLFSF
jgi:hypothetical protein